MKLNDDILRSAATMLRDEKMEILSDENEYSAHIFSDEFEQEMQELIEKVKRGEIKQKRVSMGWQYYARNGLVAVLLCFVMTFLAAPEAVIAGYHKLIEIVETIFEEYTEYRYETNEIINDELKKVSFEYMPETLSEHEESLNERLYYVLYQGEEYYFCLEQRKLSHESEMTQIIDTEDATVETVEINGDEIILVLKDGICNYLWVHEQYQISGISNLPVEEIEKIIENIQIE
ncbi:MAG: DUF4367 domain-containing protein [Peptococcaceae bacterium]|nr:DUF4367 domain-containing protein [Peptococcaceae bacterium]